MKPGTHDQTDAARSPEREGGPSTLVQWVVVTVVMAILFGGAAYLL